jgi:hypothetical protein
MSAHILHSCPLQQVFRINAGFPTSTEFLLIENRQNIAFDAKIPAGGSGLAIFHIDEAAGYSTQSYPGQTNWPAHYRVALKQVHILYTYTRRRLIVVPGPFNRLTSPSNSRG